MIDESRLESAMNYLASTDIGYAEAKTRMERAEILRKRARSRILLTTQGTVAERSALADTHEDVIAADDEYIEAIKQYETLRARRQRAELVVEVWRSLEASRRRAA